MRPKSKSAVNILGITSHSPRPVDHPTVDKNLQLLDALSRSTQCIRYFFLCIEHWISPDGQVREWLRRNVLLTAILIIPAASVMPAIRLILWQVNGWMSMLFTIAGKLTFLPVVVLLGFIVIKTITAFLKR